MDSHKSLTLSRDKFLTFLAQNYPQQENSVISAFDFTLLQFLKSEGVLATKDLYSEKLEISQIHQWLSKFKTDEIWENKNKEVNNIYVIALQIYIEFLLTSKQHEGIKLLGNNTILIESDEYEVTEGAERELHVTKYERSAKARELCIAAYGYTYKCEVCGMRFADHYGERPHGKKPYVEVHHIIRHADLSKDTGKHPVNYKDELIPVCANCHRMIHYLGEEMMHPNELKDLWNKHHLTKNQDL